MVSSPSSVMLARYIPAVLNSITMLPFLSTATTPPLPPRLGTFSCMTNWAASFSHKPLYSIKAEIS